MKSSLKKFLHHGHGHADQNQKHKGFGIQPLAKLDELAQASQDMQDMRDCYDSLLSAAAVATNSAYEFSESLKEMGVCLLQKIELNDDEETGKVMMMLGKVQFELQKVVDNYRAHICQTITVPSESLISEIDTLEEMKQQCDEKKAFYEYMRARYRDKGRPKSGKEERFSLEELQSAKDEFDEEATLFVFRLKSLKQGQSRSLLTQTTRHHAAQLSFFRKALKALEMVEPHVKSVAQQQHIDYQFSDLDDYSQDDENDYDDGEDSDGVSSASSVSSTGDPGDLSFDYGHNNQLHNPISAPGSNNNMELDLDNALPSVSSGYFAKENAKGGHEESFMQGRKLLSQSAPLFPYQKVDPAERIRQLRPSATRKFCSYALPKPGESRIPIASAFETPVSKDKPTPQLAHSLYHSCPLEHKNVGTLKATVNLSGPITPNPNTILKESNINRMPPPLIERVTLPQLNPDDTSRMKKPKLQSFSGPITSKPFSTKPPLFSVKNPLFFKERPQFSSGPILRDSVHHSTSSHTTSSAISSFSPRIRELHELPRPPANTIYISERPSGFTGFSAPLVSTSADNSIANKVSPTKNKMTPPLPTPPLVAHKFNPRVGAPSASSRASETSHSSEKSEVTASPPLTPIRLGNQHPD